MTKDVVWVYKRAGKPVGFHACTEPWFTSRFSSDGKTDISISLPTEKVKTNLRRLVKEKRASIVKAGTTEAVVFPVELIYELSR